MSWFTEQRRGYIYRILIAVGALVAGYGVISSDQLAMWLGLAVAVLNVMPTANTTVKKESEIDWAAEAAKSPME
jgi:hypothetical protein